MRSPSVKAASNKGIAVLSDSFEEAGPVQFFTFLLRLLTSFQAVANKGGTIYMFGIFFVFTAERL